MADARRRTTAPPSGAATDHKQEVLLGATQRWAEVHADSLGRNTLYLLSDLVGATTTPEQRQSAFIHELVRSPHIQGLDERIAWLKQSVVVLNHQLRPDRAQLATAQAALELIQGGLAALHGMLEQHAPQEYGEPVDLGVRLQRKSKRFDQHLRGIERAIGPLDRLSERHQNDPLAQNSASWAKLFLQGIRQLIESVGAYRPTSYEQQQFLSKLLSRLVYQQRIDTIGPEIVTRFERDSEQRQTIISACSADSSGPYYPGQYTPHPADPVFRMWTTTQIHEKWAQHAGDFQADSAEVQAAFQSLAPLTQSLLRIVVLGAFLRQLKCLHQHRILNPLITQIDLG